MQLSTSRDVWRLTASGCCLMPPFGSWRSSNRALTSSPTLENEADHLYITAIRDLAKQEGEPRRLFMLHEVYGMFEKIVNLFEDCVQAMEDSALKTLAGL